MNYLIPAHTLNREPDPNQDPFVLWLSLTLHQLESIITTARNLASALNRADDKYIPIQRITVTGAPPLHVYGHTEFYNGPGGINIRQALDADKIVDLHDSRRVLAYSVKAAVELPRTHFTFGTTFLGTRYPELVCWDWIHRRTGYRSETQLIRIEDLVVHRDKSKQRLSETSHG